MKKNIAMSLSMTIGLLVNINSFAASVGADYQTLSHNLIKIDEETVQKRFIELVERVKASTASDLEKQKQIGFLRECLNSSYWRFYMVNGGLNGPLTEYMTLYSEIAEPFGINPWGETIPKLDHWYFTEVHFIRAYQANHRNVRKFLTDTIRMLPESSPEKTIKFASVAGGTMYEFLRLPIDTKRTNVEFYGFDIDPESVKIAQANAIKEEKAVTAVVQDAWEPLKHAPFDVITCNGFTFYVEEDTKLIQLFSNLRDGLADGGKLIASFILPFSEWDTHRTSAETMEKIGFMMQTIPSKWNAAFRDKERMHGILVAAGFAPDKISFVDESFSIHPSVIAEN